MIIINPISPEEQEEILNRKMDKRLDLLASIEPSNPKFEENKILIYELCKDIKMGFQYWADNFVWIQNPRANEPEKKNIPFLLWDYQEQAATHIISAIIDGHDIPIEKSRDLGMSWLIIAIFVWGWNFLEWDLLVGSQKFENVDMRGNIKSLLEKARYIVQRCPAWMIPPLKDKLHDKTGMLVHPTHHSSLAGESNNTNFGRSDRRKAILFDEFSSWEQTDRAAWQSCSATTKCRIPLSTPNTRGTNCHFYTVTHSAKQKGKPMLRLHWTLHPLFAQGLYHDELGNARSLWYDEQCRRATSMAEVSQELDIDYEASMAGKVFPDWNDEKNIVDDLEYDPMLPAPFVSWDFGLDQTALLWIQVDKAKNTYNIIDEYVNDGSAAGVDIYHYLDILDSKPYPRGIHFGDPQSGENRTMVSRGGASNAQILRRHGYVFKSQKTGIQNRISAGRNITAQVRVSAKCTLTIEMFRAWQFVKPKTGNVSSQIPIHNEYSHLGDSFTYFAFNYKNNIKNKKPRERKDFTASTGGVVG